MKLRIKRKWGSNSDCPSHRYYDKTVEAKQVGGNSENWICTFNDESFLIHNSCLSIMYCEEKPIFCEEVKAVKNDDGKVQYSDLPLMTLESTAKAFNYGAKKYGKFNYTKGMDWLRYYDAAERHMKAWARCEDIDESTNHHLDHAIASLMMLRESIHLNKGVDNRNKDYKLNNK